MREKLRKIVNRKFSPLRVAPTVCVSCNHMHEHCYIFLDFTGIYCSACVADIVESAGRLAPK